VHPLGKVSMYDDDYVISILHNRESLVEHGIGSCKNPLCRASLITYCRSSAANTKRRGDKGSLSDSSSTFKLFARYPIEKNQRKTELDISLIHSIHLLGKTIDHMISIMDPCSTV
jgi:hypothetical protein